MTEKARIKPEHILNSQERIVNSLLREIADSKPDFSISDISTKDSKCSFGRECETEKHFHCCGLTGAIGTEEREDFTGINFKVEAVYGVEEAIRAFITSCEIGCFYYDILQWLKHMIILNLKN